MLKRRSSDKRIFLSLLVFLLCSAGFVLNPVQADTTPKPPPVSNGFSRFVQGVTGMNWLATKIGSAQIEKQLRKKVSGDLDVRLRPYSATDLMAGKARQLTLRGRHLLYEKCFYLSALDVQTDKDTPIWVDLKTGQFQQLVQAHIDAVLTPDDLNKSFKTPGMQKILGNIKIPLAGLGSQTIALRDPAIQFMPDKLFFKTRLAIADNPQQPTLPLDIDSGLKVDAAEGQIRFHQLTVRSAQSPTSLSALSHTLENALNRLLEPDKLLPLKHSKVVIQSLTLSQQTLHVKGMVYLYPPPASSTTHL